MCVTLRPNGARKMDPILTLEAKSAIQSYLLRLVAVPVVIVTVVSFLLRFAVQRWAFGDA